MTAPDREPLVLVLAAGLGTRMLSDTPKVLHRVAGRPLIHWSTETARALGARRVVVVLGHQLEQVHAALLARYGADAPAVVRQERQLGTGHAVREGLSALAEEPEDATVVILYGDVPLLSAATVRALLERRGAAPLALIATRPPEPTGYGRLVRDGAGRLVRIVEEKDASPEVKAIREVNAGIYAAQLHFLRSEIARLRADNAGAELYLTDLAERAAAASPAIGVPTIEAPFDEVAGVNDRVELARLDARARRLVAERWMRAGVTILAPETVSIEADVEAIGKDTEIGPGVTLRGATRIGARVRIDVGCVLTSTTVGDAAVIKPYSVLAESQIGARAQIGPFAHCRPGTRLEDDVHLGNFVETKKAHLGPGAKANHLSYLGDAEIGARVNVGAGTITCNYDGVHKHPTVIEEGAFIGSDTQLVAPVRVGRGAYVGAGTTVTEDVPPGALAVSRAPQKNVEGYVERKRQKQARARTDAPAKP